MSYQGKRICKGQGESRRCAMTSKCSTFRDLATASSTGLPTKREFPQHHRKWPGGRCSGSWQPPSGMESSKDCTKRFTSYNGPPRIEIVAAKTLEMGTGIR